MNENQKKPGKFSRFFEEKGFYIILFLCIAAIGIAGYVLFLAPDSGASAQSAAETPVSAEPVSNSPKTPSWSAPSGSGKGETDFPKPDAGESGGGKTTVIDVTDGVQTGTDKPDAVETVTTQPAQSSDSEKDKGSEGKASGNAAKDTAKDSSKDASKDGAKNASGGKSASGQSAPGSAAPTFFVKPVAGEVIRSFCVTELVYDRTMGDWRTHNGADFGAAAGETVSAVADGVVTKISADDFYGTTVLISHGGGLESLYCGLAAQPTVKEGDSVGAGEVIGSVGSGSHFEALEPVHLHLEMKSDGKYVDPVQYLG